MQERKLIYDKGKGINIKEWENRRQQMTLRIWYPYYRKLESRKP